MIRLAWRIHVFSKKNFLVQYLALFLLAFSPMTAKSVCNNPDDWMKAPSAEVEVLINYAPDLGAFGGWGSNSTTLVFPALLSEGILAKSGQGQLPKSAIGKVSYYEPASKGGWRVCRIETWGEPRQPSLDFNEFDKENAAMLDATRKYSAKHPILRKFSDAGHVMMSAEIFHYDLKGRISRVELGSFDPKYGLEIHTCRRYDLQDRLILLTRPINSKKCPDGEPDPRDIWLQLKHGTNAGEPVVLLHREHSGEENGKWTERWSPYRLGVEADAPYGNVFADSEDGVTSIWGSNFGKRDDNAANTVVDSYGRWNGSTYTFTKPPVPLDVTDNAENLYKYDRTRQTYLAPPDLKLFEWFPANEHISRHRYYTLSGMVLRHEQLNKEGKVTRVITIQDWRQPRPGPKPDVDDKLLKTRVPALLTHRIFHRVYDLDARGKPTLVAVSWDRNRTLNPMKNVGMSEADLVYGTPDGKERWKNAREFGKAFNTDANAAHVFPGQANGR